MRKLYIFYYVSLALLAIGLNLSGTPVQPVRTMEVPFAPAPPSIDGVADELYGPVQSTEVFNPEGYDGSFDFEAYFQVCWDYDFLYMIGIVTDDVNHSYEWGIGNPWEFDHAQVYIQLDTNTVVTSYDEATIQLRICRDLDSVQTNGRAPRSDFLYYMEGNTANGWLFEVGIPWTCVLPYGSLSDDIMDYVDNHIGFDVDFADSDNSDGDPAVGNRDVQAAWDMDDPADEWDRTEDNAWNNTSVFGIIDLMAGSTNPSPVADAGPNQTVPEGTLVTLDGTGSYDPEGEDITYTWYPPAPITLSDRYSATPTFTAPDVSSDTWYDIGLVVNDGLSNSAVDYVRIYVDFENVAPVANAGPDQTANEREIVMLDGSGSYDYDGHAIAYSWGSSHNVRLINNHTAHPILVSPDVFANETVEFYLTVNDGALDSDVDTMNLYVNSLFDEYDTLVVYDTTYVVDVVTYYNTILISVVNDQGDLIAREDGGILYVELYPNPANQFININSEMMIEDIQILNLSGDVVKYELINALEAVINLDGFTAGDYILRLNTESGIVNKQFVLE